MDSSELISLLYVIVMSTTIAVLCVLLFVNIKNARQEFINLRGTGDHSQKGTHPSAPTH